MKKIFVVFAAVFAFKTNAQQLVRATNVNMVTTAGTKIVINGGISFIGTSVLKSTGDSIYLYKTTASSPEGWLDSTTNPTGVMDVTSTGNVFFRGGFLQSFYGKTRFYNLFIRNTVGDTLLSSCEVRNILHLDTGFVFTRSGYGNDSLLVSNGATTAIVSTSTFTKSWVNGRLSRVGNTNAAGTPYIFYIGKTDSLYAPVKLQKFNTNTATWTAEYFDGQPFQYLNVFNPPVDHISRVEYWEITSNLPSGPDENARVSLSWRGHSRVSANPVIRDSLLVAQYINRPPFVWDAPGNWVTGNAVGPDSLSGYVTSSNNIYTTFDFAERRFTLGTYSKYNALPVKLLYFTAIPDGNKVKLNWEVANEMDTKTYELEKSLNAVNYFHLSTVASRQQSQSAYIDYDYSPAMGWNYYRIKIINNSGSFTYSPVRAVKFSNGLEQVNIFPNPATDILNIQLPSSYINKCSMQVFGVDGKFISSMKPWGSIVMMNVTPLPAGTYILQIIKEDGFKESFRFVKQ